MGPRPQFNVQDPRHCTYSFILPASQWRIKAVGVQDLEQMGVAGGRVTTDSDLRAFLAFIESKAQKVPSFGASIQQPLVSTTWRILQLSILPFTFRWQPHSRRGVSMGKEPQGTSHTLSPHIPFTQLIQWRVRWIIGRPQVQSKSDRGIFFGFASSTQRGCFHIP